MTQQDGAPPTPVQSLLTPGTPPCWLTSASEDRPQGIATLGQDSAEALAPHWAANSKDDRDRNSVYSPPSECPPAPIIGRGEPGRSYQQGDPGGWEDSVG